LSKLHIVSIFLNYHSIYFILFSMIIEKCPNNDFSELLKDKISNLEIQSGSDIRTSSVIERLFWPITGCSISGGLWRPSLFRYLVWIWNARNKDGRQSL
jgi:hypothetical protein